MAEAELSISGGIIGLSQDEIRNKMDRIVKMAAESAQNAIHREFKGSIELSALTGQIMDPEAVTALLRGLKVVVTRNWPPELEAKFDDDLGHLYGLDKLPDSVSKLLQEIVDSALEKWSSSPEFNNIVTSILEEN